MAMVLCRTEMAFPIPYQVALTFRWQKLTYSERIIGVNLFREDVCGTGVNLFRGCGGIGVNLFREDVCGTGVNLFREDSDLYFGTFARGALDMQWIELDMHWICAVDRVGYALDRV
eukprot:3577851-Rhodomonas_salina.1